MDESGTFKDDNFAAMRAATEAAAAAADGDAAVANGESPWTWHLVRAALMPDPCRRQLNGQLWACMVMEAGSVCSDSGMLHAFDVGGCTPDGDLVSLSFIFRGGLTGAAGGVLGDRDVMRLPDES